MCTVNKEFLFNFPECSYLKHFLCDTDNGKVKEPTILKCGYQIVFNTMR